MLDFKEAEEREKERARNAALRTRALTALRRNLACEGFFYPYSSEDRLIIDRRLRWSDEEILLRSQSLSDETLLSYRNLGAECLAYIRAQAAEIRPEIEGITGIALIRLLKEMSEGELLDLKTAVDEEITERRREGSL